MPYLAVWKNVPLSQGERRPQWRLLATLAAVVDRSHGFYLHFRRLLSLPIPGG